MFKEKSKYLRSAESGPIPTEVLSLMIDAQKNREQQDLSSRRIQITSANISSQKKKKRSPIQNGNYCACFWESTVQSHPGGPFERKNVWCSEVLLGEAVILKEWKKRAEAKKPFKIIEKSNNDNKKRFSILKLSVAIETEKEVL